jgi:hypothetical protein
MYQRLTRPWGGNLQLCNEMCIHEPGCLRPPCAHPFALFYFPASKSLFLKNSTLGVMISA